MGRTLMLLILEALQSIFQLTRPVWGEPARGGTRYREIIISTHSPRVGRTSLKIRQRTPARQFQLTRPVWGEPGDSNSRILLYSISTHSPRVGRTPRRCIAAAIDIYFNSLAPCGANHAGKLIPIYIDDFNSLAPCGANRMLCLR